MLRVIRAFAPEWVIAENVRGLLTLRGGMVFEQVCVDLENSGYEVQPFIIPAVAVNAPHRRDRVWFVAHRTGDRRQREGTAVADEKGHAQGSGQTEELAGRPEGLYDLNTNTQGQGLQRKKAARTGRAGYADKAWERNWLDVATELCGVDDGLPAELDGLKLTKAGHRTQRLKSLGNAIVPQVAIEIMQAIKACQNTPKS